MSILLSCKDPRSPTLVVLFTHVEHSGQLFLAALQWGTERSRLTHYVRKARFERIPDVSSEYFADPARLKTITFHYASDNPLEKAAQLATDFTIMDCETLMIVETHQDSYLGEHAVTNTLALLSSFSRDGRRSIICFPRDENLIMIATLFTTHIYVADENDTLSSLGEFALSTF